MKGWADLMVPVHLVQMLQMRIYASWVSPAAEKGRTRILVDG